jgi:hypothetical protein
MKPSYTIENIGRGIISVKVKIPNRKLAMHPRINVSTKEVLDFLNAEGYNDYSIVTEHPRLNNHTGKKILEGIWVFSYGHPNDVNDHSKGTLGCHEIKPNTTSRQTLDNDMSGIDYSADKEIIEKATTYKPKSRKSNRNRSTKN